MMRGAPQPPPAPAAATPPTPRVEVLVAAGDLPMGQALKASDLRWQPWPTGDRQRQSHHQVGFSGRHHRRPVGLHRSQRLLQRRADSSDKLVKGPGGFMSAILPAGMRAVAISSTTGAPLRPAASFYPNDRVDVIRTYGRRNPAPRAPTSVRRPSCATFGCSRRSARPGAATATTSSPARPRRSTSRLPVRDDHPRPESRRPPSPCAASPIVREPSRYACPRQPAEALTCPLRHPTADHVCARPFSPAPKSLPP